MKRNLLMFALFALFSLCYAAPAHAEIWSITGGNGSCDRNGVVKCSSFSYPIAAGKTVVLELQGPGLDWANKDGNQVPVTEPLANPSTGSQVTAEITQRQASRFAGIGQDLYGIISIRIVVPSNASAGERTLTLSHFVTKDYFKIKILPAPRITKATVPTFDDFFTQADVTLTGTGLQGSTMQTYTGDASGAQILSSSESEVSVRFKFPKSMAYAKAGIVLKSKDGVTITGLTNSSNTIVELVGPNAIKSISFPIRGRCGNGCFKVGDVFTVEVELIRAAANNISKTNISTSGRASRPLRGASTGGVDVTYLLVPFASFSQVSSQTPYKGDGSFNLVNIAPGNITTRFDLKVASCPGGGETNQVMIETWSDGNTDRKVEPVFKQKPFVVDCRQ